MSHGAHVKDSWPGNIHLQDAYGFELLSPSIQGTAILIQVMKIILFQSRRALLNPTSQRHTHECVMARISMSHGTHKNGCGTHMNESWCTYEGVMAYTFKVTLRNHWSQRHTHELECVSWSDKAWWRHTHEQGLPSCSWACLHNALSLMAHISWHGTRINESWRTHDGIMVHVLRSHGATVHIQWSQRHTHKCIMAHMSMSHRTHVNGSWHTRERFMLHMPRSHSERF